MVLTALSSCVLCACVLAGQAWGPTPGFPNQLGAQPLHGWRTWQAYAGAVSQELMEKVMAGMAKRRPLGEGGAMVSLLDIGYSDVGLDAGFTRHDGVNGSCHGADHHLLINTTLFPSLAAMNSKAHSLGLTSSWYLNLDSCPGDKEPFETYTEDAQDAAKYGFDGVKFDTEHGGPNHNITRWAMALNATGKQMMIENCLDKHPSYLLTDPNDCPFNFYRTGPDNAPDFLGGMYHVYNWAVPYLNTSVGGLQASRPGCFGYPDMLGIGAPVANSWAWHQARANGCADMSMDEERALFANWAIVSSPLVLGIDTTDDKAVAKYWPIISNPTALHINRVWAGEAGRLLKESPLGFRADAKVGTTCEAVQSDVAFPNWAVYSKRLAPTSAAVLAINLGNSTQHITVSFAELAGALQLPAGLRDAVRAGAPHEDGSAGALFSGTDVWTGAALPSPVTPAAPWTEALAPHTSRFLVFARIGAM